MLYSHEILTNHKHGVATIWLVAMLGPRSAARKITKKAILDVDVAKACDTIMQPPGAPIALRLQANLLYGLTRVFSEQCQYTLGDTEKIQAQMRVFLRSSESHTIDPSMGKARRQQNLIPDDPDFLANQDLPPLRIELQDDALQGPSQGSNASLSQLSPLNSQNQSFGSSAALGLRVSSPSTPEITLNSQGWHQDVATPKPQYDPMDFGDDDDLPFGNFGLAVDADGNIIEEPDLPQQPRPLHQRGPSNDVVTSGGIVGLMTSGDQAMNAAGTDDVFMEDIGTIEAPPAPDAELQTSRRQIPEPMETDELVTHSCRQRKRRAPAVFRSEVETRVSRQEFQTWSQSYVARMSRSSRIKSTTPAVARKNATDMVFGRGLGNVGVPIDASGIQYRLASDFAGSALMLLVLGFDLPQDRVAGQKRSHHSTEPLQAERERQKRRRTAEDIDAGRDQMPAMQDDSFQMMPETDVEIGRDRGSAISDIPTMPWNRHSSQLLGSDMARSSAVKTSRHRMSESPLIRHGQDLEHIERLSDDPHNNMLASDGFQPFDNASLDLQAAEGLEGPLGSSQPQPAAITGLDSDALNFLEFTEQAIASRGDYQHSRDGAGVGDGQGARHGWIEFDDLLLQANEDLDRASHHQSIPTRNVAARAFFNTLTLATKGQILVQQQCQSDEDRELKAAIWLRVRV